jgi:hypothetical protein
MLFPNKILNITPKLFDFADMVELHLSTVPGTRELEIKGQKLKAAGLPENLLKDFIEAVHHWGGSFRNYHKVIGSARPIHFTNALKALDASSAQVERALSSLLEINGLGISYGSKHLRFLRPDICPILDNIVWENFKYPWNARGYRLLQVDVMSAAKNLEENAIGNPMNRPNGRWFAADVDMAVFAFLQRKRKSCGWV